MTKARTAARHHTPLVFDYVYTTVDAEAEPFAGPEFMACGVGASILLNSNVSHGFHVQQSRRPFR
jgi:hypothetical protein